MQFYFIAPLIFILAGRGGRRRMLVFGGVALALAAVGLIYPMRGPRYLAVKYHFEIAAWPMAFGVFCEFAKSMVLRNPARCGQVYLCIRGRRLYDRRHCHVVWNGSKKACNCHRWIAVVSVPVKLFIWLYCPGSDGALARLVRRENLFDLSMATAVYDLRVPSPYVRAFGGRRLNPRWGVVVSDFRKALPKCAPDFLSSCCGTSGAGRPVSRGTCDIGLNLTVGQMFRPFSLSALAIWFV